MSSDVEEAIGYFRPGALHWFERATEERIAAAERRLLVALPPSLRAFLLTHNGLAHGEYRLLGVPPCERRHDLVGETYTCREVWRPADMVAVASDAGGDRYVLLPAEVDDRGEYPVAMFDHETGEQSGVVASCYERFLWFVLNDLRRSCEPSGEPREREGPPPWPFGDPEWIRGYDPGLRDW